PTDITPVVVNGVGATVRTNASTGALGAGSDSLAQIHTDETAQVHLQNGAFLTGQAVQLYANHTNQGYTVSANAHCGCGGGYADADANNDLHSHSTINGDSGSSIKTGGLYVDVSMSLAHDEHADANGGFLVDHSSDTSCACDATRAVHWSATTYMLG